MKRERIWEAVAWKKGEALCEVRCLYCFECVDMERWEEQESSNILLTALTHLLVFMEKDRGVLF